MDRKSILLELREVCNSFVDEHYNFRVRTTGVVERLNVNEERQELLKDIVYLLRDTNIVNEETKMYLFNRTTNKDINERLREETGKKISFNTTQSKIQYGKTKLESLFGNSIHRLMYQSYDISDIPQLIFDITSKYNDSKLRENIVLDLDKNVYNTELSEEEFNDFLKTIAPYIRTQVEFITNNIDSKKVGYFNYIITNKRLNDIDKERLDLLRKILNCEN